MAPEDEPVVISPKKQKLLNQKRATERLSKPKQNIHPYFMKNPQFLGGDGAQRATQFT